MNYTLVTKTGEIFKFYQEGVALIYMIALGGRLLKKESNEVVYASNIDQ